MERTSTRSLLADKLIQRLPNHSSETSLETAETLGDLRQMLPGELSALSLDPQSAPLASSDHLQSSILPSTFPCLKQVVSGIDFDEFVVRIAAIYGDGSDLQLLREVLILRLVADAMMHSVEMASEDSLTIGFEGSAGASAVIEVSKGETITSIMSALNGSGENNSVPADIRVFVGGPGVEIALPAIGQDQPKTVACSFLGTGWLPGEIGSPQISICVAEGRSGFAETLNQMAMIKSRLECPELLLLT